MNYIMNRNNMVKVVLYRVLKTEVFYEKYIIIRKMYIKNLFVLKF
jgi:hypothetical protein